MKVLEQFDKSISETLANNVKSKGNVKVRIHRKISTRKCVVFSIAVFLTLIERDIFTTIACVTRCGLLSSRMPLSSSTMAKCYQSIKPKLSLASLVKITVANEVSYYGIYFWFRHIMLSSSKLFFFFLLQRDVLVHMLCRSCTYNVNTNNKDREGDVKKQKNRIKTTVATTKEKHLEIYFSPLHPKKKRDCMRALSSRIEAQRHLTRCA